MNAIYRALELLLFVAMLLKVGAFRPSLRIATRARQSFRSMMASEYSDVSVSNDDTIIHLNHAGASPSPPCVLDTVIEHMELEQRIGGYAAARVRAKDLDQVYDSVARLVHASSNEIALVESATVAWTRLFYSMVDYQEEHMDSSGKKVILLSDAEYAANVVAACQWARTHDDWTVLSIPSSVDSIGRSTGVVDLDVFQSMLDGSYKYQSDLLLDPSSIALVCLTHIPTNSGIVNPAEEMGNMITEYNSKHSKDKDQILYLVDACQSVGQLDVNVQDIHCHGLTATGRKYLRGPRGTGFLFVRNDIVQLLTPNHLDHACAPVTRVPATYPSSSNVEDWLDFSLQPGAKRFEFWESNVAGKLGLGEAVRYAMDEMGMDHICACCELIVSELTALLRDMNGIELHHNSSCGIVTFSVRGVNAATVKEYMWTKQSKDHCRFEVSVVPATSTPLDSARCRVPDLVRASVSYTTSLEDIEKFCTRLKAIICEQ
jgi:cysteine desulfurase/selenocysteine lyase